MLCIEGDLRHPILASALGVGPELNLARVLEGTVALAEVTQEVALPRAENGRTPPGIVAVALGGAAPTRSTDALAWERLGAALRDAEHQFDLIVIDTAPILLVPPAIPPLSNVVGGWSWDASAGRRARPWRASGSN